MRCTVFLLVLLFSGFSLRPPCGSEQKTDRPVAIDTITPLLLSDSTVTCPFSDSSLLGLAYCFAKTCPTPSRDVQDEGPTELEPSVYPQLIGQKPLLSAVPGRFWPQMACLQERCGRISVLRLSCTGLGMKWSLSSTPCVFQMRKQRPACSQNSVKCFFHHSRTSERTCTVSPT